MICNTIEFKNVVVANNAYISAIRKLIILTFFVTGLISSHRNIRVERKQIQEHTHLNKEHHFAPSLEQVNSLAIMITFLKSV